MSRTDEDPYFDLAALTSDLLLQNAYRIMTLHVIRVSAKFEESMWPSFGSYDVSSPTVL